MKSKTLQRFPQVFLTAMALFWWFSGVVKIQHKIRTLWNRSAPPTRLSRQTGENKLVFIVFGLRFDFQNKKKENLLSKLECARV
jgi:hypothetical protein